MQRYKIKIEYEGTPFVGWQFQKNGQSVQEILQNAPLALKASKQLLNKYYDNIDNLNQIQEEAYSIVMESDDKKEALEAFLSKRKPN